MVYAIWVMEPGWFLGIYLCLHVTDDTTNRHQSVAYTLTPSIWQTQLMLTMDRGSRRPKRQDAL